MKKNLLLTAALSFVTLMSFVTWSEMHTYTIDTKSSELKWTGYHLAKSYEHWGNVNLKSGTLTTDGEKILSGTFIIDMTTLSDKDLTAEDKNKRLVNHLKSDDFFAVSEHPEAKLEITGSEKINENTLKTTANLTIRGITKEIQFDTKVNKLTESEIEAIADFKVVRTDFEVMYGWNVENAMLDDEFRMEVKLVGTK